MACPRVRAWRDGVRADLQTPHGIATFRAFIYDAADLVVKYGGSLSGEHGDGPARGELLSKMFETSLVRAFREFKAIWDPAGSMNPGKLVDAYGATDHLRRPGYHPAPVRTHFRFVDEGGLTGAALRCVGVGKCRKTTEGTMCPSYMVTRDEQHSTRGRAHLLFEMLRGATIANGFESPEVTRALDAVFTVLGDAFRREIPIVVLEPRCFAVFRDEAVNLYGVRPAARALADRALLFTAFVRPHLERGDLPSLSARALVHVHCHQRAIVGVEESAAAVRAARMDMEMPDPGCCGMAGSFGFDKRHYPVSLAIGERVLLPSVRSAARETAFIADGFSCREQIQHATGRRAYHFAEILDCRVEGS